MKQTGVYERSDKPLIGIIANSTSPTNRLDLIAELGEPHEGFFNPLKFSFKEFEGEIVPLDIQPNEILEKSGMIKAKKAMFGAVKYLSEKGVKVICFTASTKRLPGKSGQEVKKLYPEIIFSIGDNATIISYLSLVDHYLNLPDKKIKGNDKIICLGAGFLGLQTIEYLLDHGKYKYRNIKLISEQKLVMQTDRVKVVKFKKLTNNIKLFLSCSHKYSFDPIKFREYLHPEAVIIDVAVPPGISREVYEALPPSVLRFDAGDFFLEDIRYDFDPKILCFPTLGFWYGCFTEAIILAIALKNGEDLQKFNFFEVSPEIKGMLSNYLKKEDISIPLINFYKPEEIKFISLQ